MKDIKNIKTVFCIVASIVLIVIIVSFFKNLHHSDNDSELKSFISSGNFLRSSNKAIEYYVQAISIFESHGINKENFKAYFTSGSLEAPDTILQKIKSLIKEAVQCKKLGIKAPGTLDTEIFLSDGTKFDFWHFELLSKSISYFAATELLQEKDFDEAFFWAKANLVLGMQLSAIEDKSLQMYGLACKREGIEIVKDCANTLEDQKLMDWSNNMLKKIKEQSEIVRESPDKFPSFWRLLKDCIRSK